MPQLDPRQGTNEHIVIREIQYIFHFLQYSFPTYPEIDRVRIIFQLLCVKYVYY